MPGLQMKMIPLGMEKPFGDVPKMFATMHTAVRDQSAESVRFMSVYPSKSGGSTYKRTGTLRRSWSFVVKSGGKLIEGTIGSNSNIAPYNEDVQGTDQEAIFKSIGWRSIDDLSKMIDLDFPRRLQALVGRFFK